VELNEAIRCAVLEPVLDALVANGDLERMVGQLLKKETTLTPWPKRSPSAISSPSIGNAFRLLTLKPEDRSSAPGFF